jgi:hypothetical protein
VNVSRKLLNNILTGLQPAGLTIMISVIEFQLATYLCLLIFKKLNSTFKILVLTQPHKLADLWPHMIPLTCRGCRICVAVAGRWGVYGIGSRIGTSDARHWAG